MSKGETLEQALSPVFDRWVQERDLTARAEIIEAYLYLPAYIAGKYTGRGHDYDDLYQTGCLGLIKAVDGFVPSAGVFYSYAYGMILGEIKHLFRDDRIVRPPRRITETVEVLHIDSEGLEAKEDEGYDLVGVREVVQQVLDGCTDREKHIITMLIDGNTQRQVADELGTHQMEISRTYKKFRTAVRRELYEN